MMLKDAENLFGSSVAFHSCNHQASFLDLALKDLQRIGSGVGPCLPMGSNILSWRHPKIDRKESSLQNVGKTRVYLFWRLYPRNTTPFFRFSMRSAFEFVDSWCASAGKRTRFLTHLGKQLNQRPCQGNCCTQILKLLNFALGLWQ